MTEEELRKKLEASGIELTYEFEKPLNLMIKCILEVSDPNMNEFDFEDLAFAHGFMLGAVCCNHIMNEKWERHWN